LAQTGRPGVADECPLSSAKQTWKMIFCAGKLSNAKLRDRLGRSQIRILNRPLLPLPDWF
jgi:hypothetical protein